MNNPPDLSDDRALVFVHHTLQHGYPLAAEYAQFLDEPVGRYRTVEAYPLVVPFDATCHNPDCGFEHRVCGLLHREGEGHRVEGDLFAVNDEQLRLLDIEECYEPGKPDHEQDSIRRKIWVEPLAGGEAVEVWAHFNDPMAGNYLRMVNYGWAEMVPCYTLEMAEQIPKQCCIDNPGHSGRHTISKR